MTLPLALATLLETAGFGGRSGNDLWPAFLVVAAALGGLGLVAWAVKRFSRTTLRSRLSRRSLELVEVLPLGGQKRVAIVRCYDRTFVIGAGDKELSLLAEMESPEERERLEQLATRADEGAPPAVTTHTRAQQDLSAPQPLHELHPAGAARARQLPSHLAAGELRTRPSSPPVAARAAREQPRASGAAEQGFEDLIDAARERLEARIAARRAAAEPVPTPARGLAHAGPELKLEELA